MFGDFELDSCMAALLFFGVVLFCLCFPRVITWSFSFSFVSTSLAYLVWFSALQSSAASCFSYFAWLCFSRNLHFCASPLFSSNQNSTTTRARSFTKPESDHFDHCDLFKRLQSCIAPWIGRILCMDCVWFKTENLLTDNNMVCANQVQKKYKFS